MQPALVDLLSLVWFVCWSCNPTRPLCSTLCLEQQQLRRMPEECVRKSSRPPLKALRCPVIRPKRLRCVPVFVVRSAEAMRRLPGGKRPAALKPLPPEGCPLGAVLG